MVSFLYEFISFFLQSSSSLYTSSNLVWKRCERIQNAVKLIRSEQPLRKQIAPLYTQRGDRAIKGSSINQAGCGRTSDQAQVSADLRLQTHQAGMAAASLAITLLS